jgi:Flp pilus assembly protein TadG
VRLLRKFLAETRGATAIEFALLVLPFVILLIGLVEFGRALHIRNGLDSAADKVQRLIIIDPEASITDATSTARAAFLAGDSSQLSVDVQAGTSGSVDYLSIDLSYTMTLLIPVIAGGDVVLSISRKVALPN